VKVIVFVPTVMVSAPCNRALFPFVKSKRSVAPETLTPLALETLFVEEPAMAAPPDGTVRLLRLTVVVEIGIALSLSVTPPAAP
jgi:hypothetical protein